jgi:putative ABC transport system permease protein
MGRLAWSQLRFRPARALALLAGMLVATTAFAVLTAASRTSQLRTVGTVTAHFRTSYDILVRPRGARTALEARTRTVQPNFMTGSYGGITLAQYHQIQRIPGVQVAAPIAMVGYTLLRVLRPVPLPAADNARPGRQLYRFATTWVSAGGATRISQPPSYLYVTPARLTVRPSGAVAELRPGRSAATVCPATGYIAGHSPFGVAAQSASFCWSKINGNAGQFAGGPRHGAYAVLAWSLPVLIAAIDPGAEARLDRLDGAVTSGRYLAQDARPTRTQYGVTIPVLAASSSGVGEYAVTRIQRLAAPASPPDLNVAAMTRAASAPGRTVASTRSSVEQVYQQALALAASPADYPRVRDYWSAGPVRYRRGSDGHLRPVQVRNPPSAWLPGEDVTSLLSPPMDETGVQYRTLRAHVLNQTGHDERQIRVVGRFDPARIASSDPLTQVPLGPFQPVAAAPANAASRRVLHGDLLPSLNLGGYVSQPVDLVTTMAALPTLENSDFSASPPAADPISVIRVRVAGATRPDKLSLARVKVVAQQIAARTGLDVDIVTGSSPAPMTIDLPASRPGSPPLELTEGWVKKGVAVTILTAVDRQSVALFTLILVVCVLFLANSATAAVRGRRRELGVLACVGWTRSRLFAAVLGELAALGLAAGILGAAVALPLSGALGLHASQGQALLAVPVAVGVAVTAGAVPAWLAGRVDPLAAVRPPVLAVRRARHPGGITALAVLNVSRSPGRTLVGVLSLAIGIAALTLLIALTAAFRGVVVGTVLGNAVAVQVRGVDYVAVAATVALGVLAVADVVFLNIRERATELATLRSFGWRESALTRLVVTEGALVGLAGSIAGAALGLAAAAELAGGLPAGLLAAAAAVVAAGVLVTAAAAALPARLLRRLPTAYLLAEE